MNAHQRRVHRRAERRAAITALVHEGVAYATEATAYQREAQAWIALAKIDLRPSTAAAYRARAQQSAVQGAFAVARSIKAFADMGMAR